MNNTIVKSAKVAAVAVTGFVASASRVVAQDWQSWVGKVGTVKQGSDLPSFVLSLLNWAIGLTALVAVVMLIWNGVQYITAGGDEGKVEKATKGITNAIIGLVICFVSVLVVNFVISKVLTTPA